MDRWSGGVRRTVLARLSQLAAVPASRLPFFPPQAPDRAATPPLSLVARSARPSETHSTPTPGRPLGAAFALVWDCLVRTVTRKQGADCHGGANQELRGEDERSEPMVRPRAQDHCGTNNCDKSQRPSNGETREPLAGPSRLAHWPRRPLGWPDHPPAARYSSSKRQIQAGAPDQQECHEGRNSRCFRHSTQLSFY
jgi:hypothetical protein